MKCIVLFFLGLAVLAQGQIPQRPHYVYSGPQQGPRQDEWVTAETVLVAGSDPNVQGRITLRQLRAGGPVYLSAHITGLSPGQHGFHVHEKGDTGDGCVAAGPHFNPHKRNHGAPTDQHRHAGDLGNIQADYKGEASFRLQDVYISLLEGETNVVGRAFVVHEKPDDLGRGGNDESLKTGNAGKRLACGIISLTR